MLLNVVHKWQAERAPSLGSFDSTMPVCKILRCIEAKWPAQKLQIWSIASLYGCQLVDPVQCTHLKQSSLSMTSFLYCLISVQSTPGSSATACVLCIILITGLLCVGP